MVVGPIGKNSGAPTPQPGGNVDASKQAGATDPQVATGQPQAIVQQAPQQTPQQTKGAQQHAVGKTADANLTAQARGIAPQQTKEQQIRTIAQSAKTLGADPAEIKKLCDRLQGLSDHDFKKEYAFFNANIMPMGSNMDRAVRTYNELKSMQDKSPDRLTNDHVHALTRGVGENRTTTLTGAEGVIGQDGAIKAAKALTDMPKADYDAINKALSQAGRGAKGAQVPGSSPAMEKALILKAAGARYQDLSNPSKQDQLQIRSGGTSASMATILNYAKDIRGTQRATLVQQSTAIDPYEGQKSLQQRWSTSCGPTTTHAMRAELDPIYARQLHQDFIHGTSTTGAIAKEQKEDLELHGGKAVPRGTRGGDGISLEDNLNGTCTRYTGVKYKYKDVGNTVASRTKALDDAAENLKKGIDVPIRVEWKKSGSGHFMILTDVRSEGPDQLFLLTDPLEGKSVWVTKRHLASGETGFPGGRIGKMTDTY